MNPLYSFGQALELLKEGYKLRRVKWNTNVYIELQKPEKNSKINKKFLYMCDNDDLMVWMPSNSDLFSYDWEVLE